MSKTPSLRDARRAKARPVLTEQPPAAAEAAQEPAQGVALGTGRTEARSTRKRAPRATPAGLVRKSAYVPEGEWQEARAAYLADWRAGGEASSIAKWIEQAAQDFARLSPQQRGKVIPEAAPRAADGTVSGKARSYTVAEATAEAMAQAMADDQQAGRWDSESAWLRGAMARAVAAARRREGGELPQAPARLPARLTRA
ncbi:hypothetical protein AAEX63_15395 [Luteococcus sp. H138]|uniref:hypothetical protein n=1 Tax=unclassified Luteococcus TaxID=2639923 RepID=UPI00313C59C1